MKRLLGRLLLMAGATLTLLAPATSAHARPCLAKTEALKAAKAGDPIHYRQVHGTQCWYIGEGADKSEFEVSVRPPAAPSRTGTVAAARAAKPAGVTYSPEERAFWLCGPFCDTMIKEQWPRR